MTKGDNGPEGAASGFPGFVGEGVLPAEGRVMVEDPAFLNEEQPPVFVPIGGAAAQVPETGGEAGLERRGWLV